MSKFCSLANAVTNCTDNCNSCLKEQAQEEETKCQNTQNLKQNTKQR